MGSSVRSALYLSVSTVFFIAALVLSFFLLKSVSLTIDTNEKTNQNLDKNLQTTVKIPSTYTVSGAIVLQAIYQIPNTGVPIEVDGTTFPQNLDMDATDVSTIDVTKPYVSRYQYDSNGQVIEVIYTSQ